MHWRSTSVLCSWGIINAVVKWDGSLLYMSPLLECELCRPTILLSQASSLRLARNMAIVTSKPNVLRLLILRKRCAEGNSTGVFWLAHLHGPAGEVTEKEQAWGPTWQHCGQGRQHQTNQGKHRTGGGCLPQRWAAANKATHAWQLCPSALLEHRRLPWHRLGLSSWPQS